MSDSLFIMQRYLGSDDENSSNLNEGNSLREEKFILENEEPTPKRQKKSNSKFKDCEVKNTTIIKEVIDKDVSQHILNESFSVDSQILSDVKEENIDSEISIELKVKKKQKPKRKKKPSKSNIDESNTSLQKLDVSDLQNSSKNIKSEFCPIGEVKHPKDVKIKRTLPKWLSDPTIIGVDLHGQETPIEELSYLDANSVKNLKEADIQFLFPVQLAVIPWLLQSKQKSLLSHPSDLCVSAPTGSGKTLAFVLPIIQSLKDRVVCAIRAVVVLPVSELAIQVYKVFEAFVQGTDLKVCLLTGRKSLIAEQNSLVKDGIREKYSLVDIVVTTPGRILDHIYRTEGFCLRRLRYLVIDEADRMMEEIQQGWLKQIEDAVFSDSHTSNCVCFSFGNKRLLSIPTSACTFGYVTQPLQKLLYSATLSHDPEKLHSLSLYRPKLFTAMRPSEVEEEWIGKCPIPESLTIVQAVCDTHIKPMVVCHLIRQNGFKKVLCFTETVDRARRLHFILAEMGFLQTREISSYNRPIQRKIVLEQFSSGKVNILVCSDLVARGIDIEDIDCVISYDVPKFVKNYIHRIGRTARAGKSGTAITLLSRGDIPQFRKLLQSAGIATPQQIKIEYEDLKMYVDSFQKALPAAEMKLRQLKTSGVWQKKNTKLTLAHKS